MDLSQKKCIPCEGGVERLGRERVQELLGQVPGWRTTEDERKITKRFTFPDFRGAMVFLNKMAEVAESEGHHPDFSVHYNVVEVTLYTHAIGGLHDNDFILAAKIEKLR